MAELVFAEVKGQRYVDLDATMSQLEEDGVLNLQLQLLQTFDYGDNPHQSGYFLDVVGSDSQFGLQHFERVEVEGGVAPSYNNYYDLSRGRMALLRTAANFFVNQGEVPLLAAAMKHGNAAGASFGDDPEDITKKAIIGSNEDSFGATFMTSFEITDDIADVMVNYEKGDARRRIMDVVAAPSITEGAVQMLRRNDGRMRILVNPALAHLGATSLLADLGGIELRGDGQTVSIQTPNTFTLNPRDPSQEMQLWDEPYPEDEPISGELLLAEGIGSSSSSNTTTLTADRMIIGNGVGQQARHRVTDLAIQRAILSGHEDKLKGASGYTDAFMPFPDTAEMFIAAGLAEVFGLRRDNEKPNSPAISALRTANLRFPNVPNSKGLGFAH
jgi:AICAR transformylase/IMP cyclohydrolase PurH